jgi:hypothetical protein
MAGDYDVKIFGERNTSTNALDRIIRANSGSVPAPSVAVAIDPSIQWKIKACNLLHRLEPARSLAHRLREDAIDRVFRTAPDRFAWKHTATRFRTVEDFEGLAVLVTVRNPASWVQSLYRNPYHIPGQRPASLDAFLDSSLPTVGRERLEGKLYRPLDLYEEKLRSYLAFFGQLERAGIPWRLVHFETLVTDQPAGFAAIRDLLRAPADHFEPLQSSTKSQRKSLEDYREYYSTERWRDEMGAAYDRVRRDFPEALADEVGYRL